MNGKTTTTTTAAAVRFCSPVVVNAHQQTRETIRACALLNLPRPDYRATFACAMRNWFQWHKEAAAPRAEWEALTDSQKLEALKRAARVRARESVAECDKRGNYRPNYYFWAKTADDLTTIACDAFEYVETILERNEAKDAPRPLRYLLQDATDNAARKIARNEFKHAYALRYDITEDADGEPCFRAYTIEGAAPIAEPIAPDPFAYTITRDAIERAATNDTDRAIIEGLARGDSYRTIADDIGKSAMYVSRHVRVMREAYYETIK